MTTACRVPCLLAVIALFSTAIPAQMAAIGTLRVVDPQTRSEGKGLAIESYEATVVIRGRLAETTIEQVFASDADVQLEGRYSFPIPPGASLSRFAMEVNGALMEGSIVERRRGRSIYEDIVRSMKDPALLEMTEGNVFNARVFPIPPHGKKRIVCAFTQELTLQSGALVYTLPLKSEAFTSHHTGDVTITIHGEMAGGYSDMSSSFEGIFPAAPAPSFDVTYQQKGAPRGDLVLTLTPAAPQLASLEAATGASSAYALRMTAPAISPGMPDPARDLVVLVDTSASVTRDEIETAITILRDLVASLSPGDRVAVIAFDLDVETMNVSEMGIERVAARLRGRGSLGGSNLGSALAAASLHLDRDDTHRAIVLLGDGLPTLGITARDQLLAQLAATGASFLPVAIGSEHDRAFLRAAARETRGMLTVAIPGADLSGFGRSIVSMASPRGLVTDLSATVTGSEITRIPLDCVLPGGEILLTAECSGDPRELSFEIAGMLDGHPFRHTVAASEIEVTESPLVRRLHARATIDQLLVQASTPETRAQIIALSERHHIMTPYTVFLVLESEEAYREHAIAREPTQDGAAQSEGRTAGAIELVIEGQAHQDLLELDSNLDDGDSFGDRPIAGLPARSLDARPREEAAGEEPSSSINTTETGVTSLTFEGGPSPSPTSPPAEEHGDGKATPATLANPFTLLPRDQLAAAVVTCKLPTQQAAATAPEVSPEALERIETASRAVDESPRSRTARKELGLALLAAHDSSRLASWSRDWINIDPRNLTPYLHLGKALARQGHPREALRAFTSIVDVRHGEAETHRILGRLLVNHQLFEEARQQFDLAIDDRPDDPSGLQDLAQLAIAMGEFERAADLFANLAEREWPDQHGPVRDLARQQLGLLYLRLEGRALAAGDEVAAATWAERRGKLGDDHFAPRDVKVLFNWDTAGTDVDMWVTGPDGVKCYYSTKTTPMGGNLYADITTGFGPEIYYLDQAAYGDYLVEAHYYSSGAAEETHVRALVVLFEGTDRQEIHEIDLTLHTTGNVAEIARISITR